MPVPNKIKIRSALSIISCAFILCSILAAQIDSAANETLENRTLAVPILNSDITDKNPGVSQIDPNPPSSPVRLIFIHHSTGENWLNDLNGGLGLELRNNNYFVSDTNYGWGPNSIGDHTDIGHWWLWFRGPDSNEYMNALYAESDQHCDYSRLPTNPGGQNEIVMFKSCFPNSALQGDPSDPVPPIESNPLCGQDSGSEHHTVANAKGIYIDLLEYFRNHQEKLFIVIAAPPLSNAEYSSNARSFNQWLVNDWLSGYPYSNVFVFDFYNVLTTNGGTASVNDLGWAAGNHHRIWGGAIQHIFDGNPSHNVLAYPSGDDHPSRAGNLKATAEFVPLLNVAYHRWIEAVPTAPTVDNMPAFGIGKTVATIGAQITSTGGSNPQLYIGWGTIDAGTGSWQNTADLGIHGMGTYYADLSALTPGTTYYYRSYATNSAGTGWASSTASFAAANSAASNSIAIKASNGKYLCAEGGGGGSVVANRNAIGAWETFKLIDQGNGYYALQAANGQYVCAEGGGGGSVVANRNAIGVWETFRLIDQGNGYYALQAANGQYVCAEGGGGGAVVANRNAIGAWERFRLMDLQRPGKIALQVSNGQYVCAEGSGGGAVVANRNAIGAWERFNLVDRGNGYIALQASNGQYLCAEGSGGGQVVANRNAIGAWENFGLIYCGNGIVALQVSNGQYVCAEGSGGGAVVANRNAIGAWEKFKLISI
ncbi:MAG: hypothetical protein PHQ34_08025 [Methanothrix sp.]|nr:hypothetical protein [Methanothrix sp.]